MTDAHFDKNYCSLLLNLQAFMERMGLWGEGAPFKTFEKFLDTVHNKGLGTFFGISSEKNEVWRVVRKFFSVSNVNIASPNIFYAAASRFAFSLFLKTNHTRDTKLKILKHFGSQVWQRCWRWR